MSFRRRYGKSVDGAFLSPENLNRILAGLEIDEVNLKGSSLQLLNYRLSIKLHDFRVIRPLASLRKTVLPAPRAWQAEIIRDFRQGRTCCEDMMLGLERMNKACLG